MPDFLDLSFEIRDRKFTDRAWVKLESTSIFFLVFGYKNRKNCKIPFNNLGLLISSVYANYIGPSVMTDAN